MDSRAGGMGDYLKFLQVVCGERAGEQVEGDDYLKFLQCECVRSGYGSRWKRRSSKISTRCVQGCGWEQLKREII